MSWYHDPEIQGFVDERDDFEFDPEIHSFEDEQDDPLYPNFDAYEEMNPRLLARVLYNGKFVGIGWDEAEPDTSDERYRRCRIAARAALIPFWDEDVPVEPGDPLEGVVTSVLNVYAEVYQFAFGRMCCYYQAVGHISTSIFHGPCPRCRAAAQRTTASLFGEAAMVDADREFLRIDAEREAEQMALRRARMPAKDTSPHDFDSSPEFYRLGL